MSRDGKTRTGAAAPTRQSGPADEITFALRVRLDTLQAAFPALIAVCKELATHDDAAVRAGRERYSGSPRRERADSRVNPGKRSRTPSTRPSRNCLQPEATRQSDHFFLAPRGPAGRPQPQDENRATGQTDPARPATRCRGRVPTSADARTSTRERKDQPRPRDGPGRADRRLGPRERRRASGRPTRGPRTPRSRRPSSPTDGAPLTGRSAGMRR